jgi:hypothetical protein
MQTLAERIRKIADSLQGLTLETANKLDVIAKEVKNLEAEKAQKQLCIDDLRRQLQERSNADYIAKQNRG